MLVGFSYNLNFLDIISKHAPISNFIKVWPVGPSCSIRTGGQKDMTKLVVA